MLLNNGDGTFSKAVNYKSGSGSRCVVFADFNGDGNLDAGVTNRDGHTLSILLGNGNGTFQPAVNYALGNNALYILAVGDFNGDGKPDLAIASDNAQGKGAVLILLNSSPF